MHVIPVIDIKGGSVVAAREGRRETYPILTSRLTARADPSSVIDALLRLHAFSTIYIADLDALMGYGSQWPLVEALATQHGGLRFWVDQGIPGGGPRGRISANLVPVIGTESLGATTLNRWASSGTDFILSLDFRGGRLLGNRHAVEHRDLWPERLIVMALSRIGSGRGPDFARLADFRRRFPEKRLIAAGGVRHAGDLRALEDLGMHGVLLASALHSGAVGAEHLRDY